MHHGSRRHGLSMVELLSALGLLTVIGGSVLLVTRPTFAHDEQTMDQLAAPLAAALATWQQSHSNECPTLGLLETEGFLKPGTKREDAWGASFRVSCEPGELTLLSAGPDGVLGSKDDVHIAAR